MVNGWINAKIHENIVAFWGFEIFSWVLLPLSIFLYLFKYRGITPTYLGLHGKVNGKENSEYLTSICLLMIFISYPLYLTSNFIAGHIVVPSQPLFLYASVQPPSPFFKLLTALYYAMTAGIVEELYYRGIFFRIVQKLSHPRIFYLTLSPALFAIAHWEQGIQNILSTWIYGFVFCMFFLRFRNLWPLILGHIITDFIWFS